MEDERDDAGNVIPPDLGARPTCPECGDVLTDRSEPGAPPAYCDTCDREIAGILDAPPPSPFQWVTAWSVERCYGGPEEGGWWYDAGQVLASIPVRREDSAELQAARARLVELYAADLGYAIVGGDLRRVSGRDMSSVIGDSNFEITIDDEQQHDYPETRPHYE